jgi:hypothetical protein
LPLIEFICPNCQLSWNKRVPELKEIHDIQKCKRCEAEVSRQGLPSNLAVQRTGTNAATTDHIVGKDAAIRWDDFHGKKEQRDQIRGELGTHALSQTAEGSYTALTSEKLEKRKETYKKLNE